MLYVCLNTPLQFSKMANLEIFQIDLECGHNGDEGEEGSVCFSDAEEGSCNSQFYSTADGDDYSFACGSGSLEDGGFDCSSVSDQSDCSVDLEMGEKGFDLDETERDCRICHLSLLSSSPGNGVAIELGCSCKDDLSVAHKQCAETWFKIKGNKTCEICNSIARNMVGPNDMEAIQEVEVAAIVTASSEPSASTERPSCLNGHRFLNLVLACMVFAFVISWLFHFSIPSS